ncbi:MAG: sugar phosphate isomerase/epimerase [Puniceicoccaceae bacterium]|nr:MAG: sugar phosphate isomerase/epimerase [Puniceicoccaceae bacterium]
MKLEQVALQFYTLREHAKTAADFTAACKKVREIGYTAVQLSAIGPIPEEEIVRILKGEGLVCCATHEGSDTILQEPAKVVDRLKKLGCPHTAYPFPRGVDFGDPKSVAALIEGLDQAGAVLAAAGQTLSYHNHGIEFVRHGDATVLDAIYAGTKPAHLKAELDTYWVQYGGGDPVAWCEKMAGRMPLIHLKDYTFTTENKPTFCEIGNGNLDFRRIVAAAEKAGCEWFIVEQDTCPGDPFDSIRQSFDYIRDHLVAP